MKAAAQSLKGRQQHKVQDETANARIRKTLKEEECSSRDEAKISLQYGLQKTTIGA